ncbi:MAG: Global nitrogen regulator [Chloroflexi bacterium ADurb.Bin325]|nr:MAG: Global nitrogen regulator [Chloroflexi bacterium ADurb.Bin325]
MLDQYASLGAAALFKGLGEAEWRAVVAAADRRRARAGAFFYHQGDAAAHYYMLLQGRARLIQVTPEGNQVILHLLSPGEAFGVAAAVLGGEFPASAEVIEDAEALVWGGAAMQRLMVEHPLLAINALRLVADRLHEIQNRYRELATERVARRIARTVLRLARQVGRRTAEGILIDLSLSRQDLAEMTGTTLYTVSRTLTAWEQAGLVDAGRERLLIRKVHSLVMIAEDLPSDSA